MREKLAMIKHPAIPYIAPFVAFLCFLPLRGNLPWEYAIRVAVVAAILILLSRGVLSFRVANPLGSILMGVLVFAVWICSDLLWPAYRQYWLFNNMITGAARSSLPEHARADAGFLMIRILGTVVLVPIIEELFWRGWLMRYLISPQFQSVRLGAYSPLSFWLTALLFASEHGPYWDVGLLAGTAFNLWMVRTRSLGDCILAHGITNGCLAAYVITAGQWQYWL